MSVNEKMTAIADAIRDKTKGTEPLTLDGMATEIPKVFEEGKKVEHDAFWDIYQSRGKPRAYQYAFGLGFGDNNFRPKYDIVTNGGYSASNMFWYCYVTNLAQLLKDCDVKLDVSAGGIMNGMFQYSKITHIPELDFSKATNMQYTFYGAEQLISIEKIIVSATTPFHISSFNTCSSLENVIFEGVIGTNGFDVHWSTKLNKASIESIINALSSTTSGLTVTLSKTAVNNAFTAEEWDALEATKTNWTILLV